MRRSVPLTTSTLPVVVDVRPERTNDLAEESGAQQKSTEVSKEPVNTVSSSGGVPQRVSLPRLTSVPLSTWQVMACALLRASDVSRRQKLVNTQGWEMPSEVFAPSNVTVWPGGSRCILGVPALMP